MKKALFTALTPTDRQRRTFRSWWWVSGYDVVAAQTVHARKFYDHLKIRFGHRYAEILGTMEDGRLRVDYGMFHQTIPD